MYALSLLMLIFELWPAVRRRLVRGLARAGRLLLVCLFICSLVLHCFYFISFFWLRLFHIFVFISKKFTTRFNTILYVFIYIHTCLYICICIQIYQIIFWFGDQLSLVHVYANTNTYTCILYTLYKCAFVHIFVIIYILVWSTLLTALNYSTYRNNKSNFSFDFRYTNSVSDDVNFRTCLVGNTKTSARSIGALERFAPLYNNYVPACIIAQYNHHSQLKCRGY